MRRPQRRIRRRQRRRCRRRASSALHLVALGLQRVDAQVERRRLVRGCRPAARTRRRAAACKRSASQSGRLWRSFSGRLRAVDRARPARATAARPRSSAARRKPSLPCQAEQRQAPLELALARLREVLEQQPLAQHRVGRLGQRVALALPERAVLRGRSRRRRRRPGARSCSTRCSSSVRELEQGVRMHRRIILGRCRPTAARRQRAALRRVARLKRTLRHLRAHPASSLPRWPASPRGLLIPDVPTAVTRCLIGWNVGVWLYLALVALHDRARRSRPPEAGRDGAGRRREDGARGRRTRRRSSSLGAIVIELSAAKAPDARHALAAHRARARHRGRLVAAAADPVRASTTRASYHAESAGSGLGFPGRGAERSSRTTATSSTSRSRSRSPRRPPTSRSRRGAMRRLVLLQSVLSFVFNTTILAFSINMAASLF